ncbi:MAG TPA: insulinase family protein, partial [Candidatus Hydrogenedentes bacterium]|nr:insulinase family protein [Candidatus Hydrogenedentota bacterium]
MAAGAAEIGAGAEAETADPAAGTIGTAADGRGARKQELLNEASSYTEDLVEARKLANGVTVTLERMPHVRSAAAGIWVKAGSVNEPVNQCGICHFLEHLLFKGTAKRSARELVAAIESDGGQINAFTTRDFICLYVKTLDTHIHNGIDILADIIKNSTFADLEKERNVVLDEIASVEDVPEDYVQELLTAQLWPGHPLGNPVSGTLESVTPLGLDEVRAFYQNWYHPRTLYFSVAGSFDQDAVLDQICRELGDLAPRPILPGCRPPTFTPGVRTLERPIVQDHLCIGFPALSVSDPCRYAYDVLCNALGGGSTSRLFDRIRESEGLAYAIYAFHASYGLAGMLGVYAAVAPHNLVRAKDVIFEELRRLRDEPLPEDELASSREQLKGN